MLSMASTYTPNKLAGKMLLNRMWVLKPGGESGASKDDWLNISLSVARTSDTKPLNKLTSLPPKHESAFDSDTARNGNDSLQTHTELGKSANGAVNVILGTGTAQSL